MLNACSIAGFNCTIEEQRFVGPFEITPCSTIATSAGGDSRASADVRKDFATNEVTLCIFELYCAIYLCF
jgi:hypothetical protein